MFHGSARGDPKVIYESEDGLDIRFARPGMYGVGIYFADNAKYSHSYAFKNSDGTFSMFLCFVLPGLSAYDPPERTGLRIPPILKAGSSDRFDTVTNYDRTHVITYANSKSYPAYLINYSIDWLKTNSTLSDIHAKAD